MKKEICYLCGKEISKREWTKDHVPPKLFYIRNKKPKNLKTLKCCKTCNNSYSKDEEYFMDLIAISVNDANTIGKEKSWDRVKAILRNGNEKYHSMLLSNIKIEEVRTPGGIIIGKVPAMDIDFGRRKRVIEKIVNGLHYLKYGHLLVKTPHSIKSFFLSDGYKTPTGYCTYQTILQDPAVSNLLQQLRTYLHYKDIFTASSVQIYNEKQQYLTVWALEFFNTHVTTTYIQEQL